MKLTSILFLRLALSGLALAGAALAIAIFPGVLRPENYDYLPLAIGMYLAAIPYFIAIYQAFKLLRLIDANQSFSPASITTLKYIKRCAAAVSIIYLIILPYFYVLADEDDAPGLMLIGLIAVGAPIVMAVFIGVLQKLLQNAIDLKAENDLTV